MHHKSGGIIGAHFSSDEERHDYVAHRIEEKLTDYVDYDFTLLEVRALNIFFDLAQEVRGRDMFYAVCLMIPRVLFGLKATIYILEDQDTFVVGGTSGDKSVMEPTRTWDDELTDKVVYKDDRMFVPIRCNPEYANLLAFEPRNHIIGCFEMWPSSSLTEHQRLFLEKYVNRIGYQLHHRLIRSRNREHIRFIKSMVQDIGHNVIVPNMYFKLYFNRLKRRIEELHVSTEKVLISMGECGQQSCIDVGNELALTAASIESQYQEIYRHYEVTSMFLETLLRRRHFEEGRYVLMKREVNLRTGVLEPQVERCRQRFEEKNIEIGFALGGVPDQVIRLVMDPGLIAQVYANYFSNALKYTEEATLPDGRTGRFVSYGWQVLKDHFGPDKPGIKMWVVSTGRPLDLENPMDVFKPGFRADNVAKESGSGRGLYFVRQVVELHGGTVGYEHNEHGNEFSLILPFEQEENLE
ncbi:HAMP domain-containing sensor histidine kinase [Pseudodesulfovibrio sp. zrk46]|uniref:sensor histidine kinase n=1 Tax=Pseudodesulfovibrio sp. zrk46 TaxID=2725288 RepID=UPI001448D767|nr:HAMP domain-containing sensor histidine kinase [Pseudodesulfovibrio sp. zrk46]QJB55872.1 HAMP domain-containing histidine kinase [Pseudodesulfovibrio sp. zrk46]